jgi:uncharacterized protein (DUF885 family)
MWLQRGGRAGLKWVAGCCIGLSGLLLGAGPETPEAFESAFAGLRESQGEMPEVQRLKSLFSLQWRYSMWDSPESATYTGYPEFNHRWADLGREAIERRKREVTRTRSTLNSIGVSTLDEESRLHRDLFDAYLKMDEEGIRFPGEYLILNQLQGPQQDVAQTLSLMSGTTPRGVEDVLSRLDATAGYVRQCIALLREGLAKGITPPAIVLREVPGQMLNLMPEDPAKSPFLLPLSTLPTAATEAEKAAWRGRALASITNGVYPAFKELHRFLVSE